MAGVGVRQRSQVREKTLCSRKQDQRARGRGVYGCNQHPVPPPPARGASGYFPSFLSSLVSGTQHLPILNRSLLAQHANNLRLLPEKIQGSAQVTRLAGVPGCALTTAPSRETYWCRHTSHSPRPRSALCPIPALSTLLSAAGFHTGRLPACRDPV